MRTERVKRNIRLAAIVFIVLIAATGFAYADTPTYPQDFGTLEDSYAGKTVILQSNDVHGAIAGYVKMAGLRDELQKRGADVYLVDSGDFLQGSVYVAWDQGRSAIRMMNAVNYDLAAIGNHAFDYGYPTLMKDLQEAKFMVLCDNIIDDKDKQVFAGTDIITNGDLKIGFFAVDTPLTKTQSMPANTEGLTFLNDMTEPTIYRQAAADIETLRSQGADLVIGLTHLGVDAGAEPFRSIDLWNETKGSGADPAVDLLLDGHSHTVMTAGDNGEPILSTGAKFANIGVVVIDEATKKIDKRFLYKVGDIQWTNASVKKISDEVTEKVDKMYAETIGTSTQELNGCRDAEEAKEKGKPYANGNRDGETNFGDFAADAFRAQALRELAAGTKYDVDEDHIVAVLNGGAIRAALPEGDVTKKDILTAFPFGTSVCGVYVTGEHLLEALEASTFCTPQAVGGFPQVAGIEFTVDTRYDYYPQAKPYPGSEYYGPKYIRRVTINSINGKPFDKKDTYLVMANNFCAFGGDTYYILSKSEKIFDTGVIDADCLIDYMNGELQGTIGTQYAQPAGRITVRTDKKMKTPNPMTVKAVGTKVSAGKVKKKAVTVQPLQVKDAESTVTYKKVSGSKQLKLNAKTGKVCVKKGTKKGLYKITVKVRAAGNRYYKAKTVKVTAKVRVK